MSIYVVQAHWISLSPGANSISYKVFVFTDKADAISHSFNLATIHHEDNEKEESPLERNESGRYHVMNRGEILVVELEEKKKTESLVASGTFAL